MTTTQQTPPRVTAPSTGIADRVLPVLAAAGVMAFVVLSIVAGALDSGYGVVHEGVSALASTESESATVMIIGFAAAGVGLVAAGIALGRGLQGKAAKVGAAFVVVSGALMVACGFLRQSCSTLQQACQDRETAGEVSDAHVAHNLTALVLFVLLVAAGYVFASALHRNDGVSSWSVPTRLAAVAATGFFVWFGSDAYGDFGGLVQRGLILLTFGLPVVLAFRVGARR